MSPLSKDQKSKLVQFYWQTNSIILTQRKFRAHFQTRDAPDRKTILRLCEQFLREGSINNLNKGRSGRKAVARTPETIAKVKAAINDDPSKSLRKLAQEVNGSYSSVWRIVKKDLGLTPYKVTIHHQLSEGDQAQRASFARWFSQKCETDPAFLENIWFSDEAHFQLDGCVNTQNCRIWANERPDVVLEKPLHSQKITAWCAFSAKGIIGPFWFQQKDGSAATITKERYTKMLDRFWIRLQDKHEKNINVFWFQQDGATPHTSNIAIEWLQKHFCGRVVSRKTEHPWPAHSPDLTPLDFYLWGYLKSRVYQGSPKTLQDLKTAIGREIRRIPHETRVRVMAEVKHRADLCQSRNGRHLEHVLH